jgi:hypothetical protein
MGSELDGSVTVKSWGNGRNRTDAVEQAKKNAVHSILFEGIKNGRSGCDRSPLIIATRAESEFSDYFNIFFSDSGGYLGFVNVKDERIGEKVKRDRKKARGSVTNSVILRVDIAGLRKKMIVDGIIQK